MILTKAWFSRENDYREKCSRAEMILVRPKSSHRKNPRGTKILARRPRSLLNQTARKTKILAGWLRSSRLNSSWAQDPRQTKQFRETSQIRTSRDQIAREPKILVIPSSFARLTRPRTSRDQAARRTHRLCKPWPSGAPYTSQHLAREHIQVQLS